ncbi:MAG: glycosyltransferase family 2 protein [Phycisphaerae bacterium]
MSVYVCVPTASEINGSTSAAVFRICAGHPGGAEYWCIQARPTDFARNQCVERFLQSQHSHILFIDSDVIPPDDCLQRLLAANRPLVCGVYPLMLAQARICTSVANRRPDGRYEFIQELPRHPFEVDAAGMGCCLIAREVLETMPYPWFRFDQGAGGQLTGEDIYFFEKAEGLGYKPVVIPDVQCGHMKTVDLMDVLRCYWEASNRSQEDVKIALA